MNTKEQLERTVKRIANEISNPDKESDWWQEWLEYCTDEYVDDESTEPHAKAYLHDSLDIRYTMSSQGEYLGAEIAVGLGGPNIWINTNTREVEGYWGGDKATWPFRDGLGLDDYLEEYFHMVKGGY